MAEVRVVDERRTRVLILANDSLGRKLALALEAVKLTHGEIDVVLSEGPSQTAVERYAAEVSAADLAMMALPKSEESGLPYYRRFERNKWRPR